MIHERKGKYRNDLAFVGTAIFAFILPLNPTKIVRRGLREDEKVCKKEEKQLRELH